MKLKPLWKVTLTLAAAVLGPFAGAQTYPDKPIRFVVGFPAGSSIDTVSRVVLEDIRTRTGASIVVDNKPGALGALGMEYVIRSAPDGYTLMPSSSATHSSGPSLSKALDKMDPVHSLTHIGRVARFDIVVVTRAGGPYGTARALVDAGRARPDALTFGYGSGTGQVSSVAFSQVTRVQARAIPYRGQPAAVTDLIGQQIDFVSSDVGAVLPFVRQGSLNAVAVLAERRSGLLPDVPTMAEAGLPPLILSGWLGVDGPGKLPPEVVGWWGRQLKISLDKAVVQEKIRTLGMEAWPQDAEPFREFVQKEKSRWASHVSAAALQPE